MQLTYISTARIPGEKANTYQVLQMCDAFSAQGIQVTMLYPQRYNIPEMRKVQDIRGYYGLRQDFSMLALPAFDLIYPSGRLFALSPRLIRSLQNRLFRWMIASYSRSALRFLETRPADVYYTRSPEFAQKLLDRYPTVAKKLFLEIHALPDSATQQKAQANLVNDIGGVITMTGYIKQSYIEQGIEEAHILVAPDGVNLEHFLARSADKLSARLELGLPQGIFLVGYVGRLQTLGQEKGVSHLIEALALLKTSAPQFKVGLCCVGGPEEISAEYLELARQKGLSPQETLFLPQVPPIEIPRYLSAFDCCAMAFPWTQHYAYYMSPLKLFEYMASQRPILATLLPSVQEILRHKHNAYLVEPENPRALAAGIQWVAENPQAAQSLADQAWQDVQNYTWDKRAGRILVFMRQVMDLHHD